MKILLVNNEVTKADEGWIERSVELGLPNRINQIENLAAVLREYGEVEIIHHEDLDPAAVDADCVFLSGTFSALEEGGLQRRYAAELELIRMAKQPVFAICLGGSGSCSGFRCTVSIHERRSHGVWFYRCCALRVPSAACGDGRKNDAFCLPWKRGVCGSGRLFCFLPQRTPVGCS